jgi:hypothetical protein
MLSLVIFGSFFALALAGIPLMIALLATTIGIVTIYGMQYPLESVFLSFIGGVEPFILIAVPLFVFTGELLAKGGVGKRIVEFARHLLLAVWWRVGLGDCRYCSHWFSRDSGHAGARLLARICRCIGGSVRHFGTADATIDPVFSLCVCIGCLHAHAVHGRFGTGIALGDGIDWRLHVAWQIYWCRHRR